MIILKRLTTYLAILAALVLLWYGSVEPSSWLMITISLAVVPVIAIIIMRQPQWRMEYIGLTIGSIVLLLSAYSFILIQEAQWVINCIILVTVAFYGLFMKNLSLYLFDPSKYVTYSLEHISKYSNIVASFYLYSSLFMLYILGITRLRYLIAIAFGTTLVLVWQTFWIQKVQLSKATHYIVLITLVMIEGFWALHYWPVSFIVSGFVLTIALYVLLHISRHSITQTLSRSLVLRYTITSCIAVVILLATAQWFIS